MRPILIFDKSFLQSLSIDESVWLDAFFYSNIIPIFFIETLGDLDKDMKKGRSPEQVVGNLAEKTPDMHSFPNMHHSSVLEGELLHHKVVDMDTGRPIVAGGKYTESDGQKGLIFQQSPEEKALARWQEGKFEELEREYAKAWRKALSRISPNDQKLMFGSWYGTNKPRDMKTILTHVDDFIDGEDQYRAIIHGLSLLNIDRNLHDRIIDDWVRLGKPPLSSFMMYFRHIYRIEQFFYLARAADLISERRSNKIDIAYLYYLPFCMIFVSNDKLHRNIVPLFLRPNQSFVWGPELKTDLKRLDEYFSSLPEEIRNRGIHHFASYPPKDNSFLVTRLWDKHMSPNWRKSDPSRLSKTADISEKEIIAKMNRAIENAKNTDQLKDIDSDSADFIVTQHFVSKKKGKWKRFPPEIDDSNDTNNP